MQSRNPVFARAAGFNGRTNAYGNPTYAGSGQPYADYGVGMPFARGGSMTIDSVVQKTGLTLLVMVLAAGVTWFGTGDITTADPQRVRVLIGLAMAGGLAGMVLSFVISFKAKINPGLVLLYAACEGLFLGAVSKSFEAQWPGIVMTAVLGTVVAAGSTLAAYKFLNIRVGNRFRKWVTAFMLGFVAVSLLDWVLAIFHSQVGINQIHGIGFIFSFIGLALGVLMLVMDFDYVERGVAAGLPEVESWRAAFGLTVAIVWIYIELLRIIAALRDN